MILMLGTPDDEHITLLAEKLSQRGEETLVFDTRRFPHEVRIAFNEEEPLKGYYQDLAAGRKIPVSEIRALYWKLFMGLVPRGVTDSFLHEVAGRELKSAIGSFLRSLPCLSVNSIASVEHHQYKGHQLQLLKKAGLRVPRTLITNDPDALREFYEQEGRKVIFKPVGGGAHTALLTEEDFKSERLEELGNAPVQFQEYIPGLDIRVYTFEDAFFAAEIHSGTLDFRDNPRAGLVPITLPDPVLDQCRILLKTLGLVFSGIDIRRTPEGEYVFFEGNPCPMFKVFEERTGLPVSGRLVDLLMQD